ncbi:MAG: hypothetical protein H9897_02425 [Candidatus Ureaplasma intestinipullorum]|uniref:Uncharacterized protein n=1 Tax=Candidatus Ureaplasma intestinipullorum TaxID=2838770 RepID=A0A9E2NW63_9BACT|nr:hypothetical protein [Candidatus Ureaplasma intestinipullorum]
MNIKEFSVGNKIEQNLRSPKKYKYTWLIIGLVTLFIIGLNIVPIIFLNVKHSDATQNILNMNQSYLNASTIINYIVFGVMFIPYLYLSASWIVGIDNITKSKKFHLLIWIIYTICACLALIAIVLCFRGLLI